MKEKYFYTVSTVAAGAIFLLAVATVIVWVSLTAAERDVATLAFAIIFLLGSSFWVVQGIRKKPLPTRPRFKWFMLAAGLLWISFLFLRVAGAETPGLAGIFEWLIGLFLAVYFLSTAIASGLHKS